MGMLTIIQNITSNLQDYLFNSVLSQFDHSYAQVLSLNTHKGLYRQIPFLYSLFVIAVQRIKESII